MAMTKTEFIEKFATNPRILVEFVKKDGTSRKMLCTRDMDVVPTEHHPKNKSVNDTDYVHVYDLEANGWRSIYPDTITYWEIVK